MSLNNGVLDVKARWMRVYAQPQAGDYTASTLFNEPDTVMFARLPDIVFTVSDLFDHAPPIQSL
ncbi:MAG: hypothetical protein SGI73_14685 [Chloroflexota bacterium]|nr:hypothetical protein [Chloroflexota bacterium]